MGRKATLQNKERRKKRKSNTTLYVLQITAAEPGGTDRLTVLKLRRRDDVPQNIVHCSVVEPTECPAGRYPDFEGFEDEDYF